MFEKVLKGLGLDAKDIAEIAKAEKEENKDFDTDAILAKFKETQKKLFENDPDLVSEIAGKEKGKILDIVTRKLKSEFGLDSASIKDKTVEEVIKIAKAEGSKAQSKDLQTLQEENIQLTNKVKDFEDVQIPKIKSEVELEKKTFRINNKLSEKIPVADLRVPLTTAKKTLYADLFEAYDIDLDDKDNFILRKKGTSLEARNADGTKILTIDEVMTDILKANQYTKESNADDAGKGGDAGKKDIQPDAKKKEEFSKLPLGQQKAIIHLEKLKAEKEAATKESTVAK